MKLSSRHAVIDLSLVFSTSPQEPDPDRLPPEKLAELRLMYEPYMQTLATYFQVRLPPWVADESWKDNWQGSFWEQRGKDKKTMHKRWSDHF